MLILTVHSKNSGRYELAVTDTELNLYGMAKDALLTYFTQPQAASEVSTFLMRFLVANSIIPDYTFEKFLDISPHNEPYTIGVKDSTDTLKLTLCEVT